MGIYNVPKFPVYFRIFLGGLFWKRLAKTPSLRYWLIDIQCKTKRYAIIHPCPTFIPAGAVHPLKWSFRPVYCNFSFTYEDMVWSIGQIYFVFLLMIKCDSYFRTIVSVSGEHLYHMKGTVWTICMYIHSYVSNLYAIPNCIKYGHCLSIKLPQVANVRQWASWEIQERSDVASKHVLMHLINSCPVDFLLFLFDEAWKYISIVLSFSTLRWYILHWHSCWCFGDATLSRFIPLQQQIWWCI